MASFKVIVIVRVAMRWLILAVIAPHRNLEDSTAVPSRPDVALTPMPLLEEAESPGPLDDCACTRDPRVYQ
jgi:hypothetical protein